MILNRLFRSFRTLDVKYLVVEFLLLFASISLSLYFNDLQTARAERKKEQAILLQMYKAVRADTTTMRILKTVNRDVSVKMTYLLDSARLQKTPDDKTTRYLAHINLYWSFHPDLTAYQNLQHEGLTLIEDHETRLAVIKYYDHIQSQRTFIESITTNHFQTLTPYIIDEFVDYKLEEEAVPEDFEKLKKDKRFWKLVRRSKMFCDITANQLEGRISEARQFIEVLNKRIDAY
jgi:hypothetical protein